MLGVWRPWAADLHGATLDCGHHLAEEAPQELSRLLLGFTGKGSAGPGPDPVEAR